jgi:hypothetical protein
MRLQRITTDSDYERLQIIKGKYDPDSLFHGALDIVPRR